jgi:hypothetical protein
MGDTTTRRSAPVRTRSRWRGWLPIAAGVLLLLIAGAVTWVLWPEPARSREYRQESACLLLAGPDGLDGPQSGQLWAGMQEASVDTLVRVQRRAVRGPQTLENTRAFLAGLTSARCDVIVAGGDLANQAVRVDAPSHPGIRFVVTDRRGPAANVLPLDPGVPGGWKDAVENELVRFAG